jgi:hypothetical protein
MEETPKWCFKSALMIKYATTTTQSTEHFSNNMELQLLSRILSRKMDSASTGKELETQCCLAHDVRTMDSAGQEGVGMTQTITMKT